MTLKRQSEDASMRDAIPLVRIQGSAVDDARHVRSLFRPEGDPWRTSNIVARRRVFFAMHARYRCNHGYFRISLIASRVASRTVGTAGEIRRQRHRRNVRPELIELRGQASLLSRYGAFLRMAPRIIGRAQRSTYDPKRRNKHLAKPIRLYETERLD